MPRSSPPTRTEHPVPPRLQHRLVAEVAESPALDAPGPIIVGVSGGGDSLALLHLLRDAAPERMLIAAVIDHALRPESANEAAHAAELARDIGADAVVIRLQWSDDRAARSQDASRQARHRALARLATARGARILCLGHTRDDQAETVLMRHDAGSGSRGLAGMAALSPSPVWPEGRDLWVARPVLGVSRADLRSHLRDAGLSWIEDPSNAIMKFARVRARAQLAESGETGRLIAVADRQARLAEAEDRAALAAIDRFVAFEGGDVLARLELLSAPGAAPALSALALGVGGGAREPGPGAAARLLARLAAGRGATLGGARFVVSGDVLRITRDPGGVHGRRGGGRQAASLALPAGETVVWDNRIALCAAAAGWVAKAPADRRQAAPDLVYGSASPDPGAPVDCRWLVEDRVRRHLWRAGPVGFR